MEAWGLADSAGRCNHINAASAVSGMYCTYRIPYTYTLPTCITTMAACRSHQCRGSKDEQGCRGTGAQHNTCWGWLHSQSSPPHKQQGTLISHKYTCTCHYSQSATLATAHDPHIRTHTHMLRWCTAQDCSSRRHSSQSHAICMWHRAHRLVNFPSTVHALPFRQAHKFKCKFQGTCVS